MNDAGKRLKVAQDHEAATAERTKAEATAAATAKVASPTPDVNSEPQAGEQSHSHRPEQQHDNAKPCEQEPHGHAKQPEQEQCDHADHPKEAAPDDTKPGKTKSEDEEMQPPTSSQKHHGKHAHNQRDKHGDKSEPSSSEEDPAPAGSSGVYTWSVRPEPEKPDYGKLFDKFITGPASRSTTSESGSQASHGPNKAPKFTA